MLEQTYVYICPDNTQPDDQTPWDTVSLILRELTMYIRPCSLSGYYSKRAQWIREERGTGRNRSRRAHKIHCRDPVGIEMTGAWELVEGTKEYDLAEIVDPEQLAQNQALIMDDGDGNLKIIIRAIGGSKIIPDRKKVI